MLRMAITVVTLLSVLAGMLSAAAQQKAAPQSSQKPGAAPPASARDLLKSAKSWAYQLQGINAAALARTSYDVLVLDGDLGRADVQRLKRKPDGRPRLVLAYVNIGEAEDYRSYWKKAWATAPPEWMGGANTRWQGDHRVRHWHPDWQAILFGNPASVFARLIANGFDGAYLDRVDIYAYWCGERPSSFDDMIAFVEALSQWSKAQRPGFLILPQNGEELLASQRYRAAIDGIGKEDFFFGDRGNDVMNYDTRIELQLELFGHAHRDGLPVLAVEYARQPANQEIARRRHGELGHVLYFAPRSLAYIGQTGPRHKEDGDTEPYLALRGRRGCDG